MACGRGELIMQGGVPSNDILKICRVSHTDASGDASSFGTPTYQTAKYLPNTNLYEDDNSIDPYSLGINLAKKTLKNSKK
jgi:hypothetical protein